MLSADPIKQEIKARDVKIQELETDQDRKIMNLEFTVSELLSDIIISTMCPISVDS